MPHRIEAILLLICPDGGQAVQGFRELLIDGALGHSVHALELTSSPPVDLQMATRDFSQQIRRHKKHFSGL